MIMATAAPINALNGDTKNTPAKKAKTSPAAEPSRVFSLLNEYVLFPNMPPKIEAALSPTANVAMAALLAGIGKSTNVSKMPRAKSMGAVANS